MAWLTTQGCTGQTFWVRKESGSFLYVNPNIDIGLYSSEFLFSLKNSNRAEPPACVTEYLNSRGVEEEILATWAYRVK